MAEKKDKGWLLLLLLGGVGALALLGRKVKPPIPKPTLEDVSKTLDKYRVTTKSGGNPWTGEALGNVLRYRVFVDRAVALVNGRLTSMYRSPQINAQVKGADPNSNHIWGKATDLVPRRGFSLATARDKIKSVAEAENWPIKSVEIHRNHIHIEWGG